MAVQRIVDTSSHDESEEEQIEVTLRPRFFAEYVGQERLKKNLKLAIEAAKKELSAIRKANKGTDAEIRRLQTSTRKRLDRIQENLRHVEAVR